MQRRILAVLSIPAITVSLVACSGDSSNSAESPVTITSTVEVAAPTTTDAAPQESETDSANTPVSPTSPARSNTGNHNINAGQVGGDCGTTEFGDSIRVGAATSCEFAGAIFDQAYNAEWYVRDGGEHVNDSSVADIVAVSPVTGDSYNLSCVVGSDARGMSCRDNTREDVWASFTDDTTHRIWHDRIDTGWD